MIYQNKDKIIALNIKSIIEKKENRKIEYDRLGNLISYIDDFTKTYYKYDFNGNEIEKKYYNGSNLVYHVVFENILDELERIVEKRVLNLSGEVIEVLFYEYNHFGNIIEEIVLENDIVTEKKVYRYNTKKERIVESFSSLNSGEIKIYNKFDPNGNKIESVAHNDDGSENAKWFWKYDENGNNIEFTSLNYSLGRNQKQIYEYNNDGLLIKNSIYDGDNILMLVEDYEYELFN